jgi:aldehyde:ferredoxin oxidoreductase
VEGYAGKILEIDLSTGKIGTLSVSRDDQKKFIGGSGLAAKIYFDSFDPRGLKCLKTSVFDGAG